MRGYDCRTGTTPSLANISVSMGVTSGPVSLTSSYSQDQYGSLNCTSMPPYGRDWSDLDNYAINAKNGYWKAACYGSSLPCSPSNNSGSRSSQGDDLGVVWRFPVNGPAPVYVAYFVYEAVAQFYCGSLYPGDCFLPI
jgi:hypothetical protein